MLQSFKHSTETLARLKSVYGRAGIPRATVPDDWRSVNVLAPARIRLAQGTELVGYEDPALLRSLEERFAGFLESAQIPSLDIPALRSKDRVVSQRFGRFLYDQGYAGILFESANPPGGTCVALFEGRAWLEASGPARKLAKSWPGLRRVCQELHLGLS